MPVAIASTVEEPLRPADFKVRLNGADARVSRVRGPADDLVLLLAFDVAGDIAAVEAAKQTLIARVRELPGNIYIGVLRTHDSLEVALDPTGDRDAAAAAIEAIPVGGKAGLLDSISTAAHLADTLTTKAGVRSAVLYITDSDVANYREDFTNPVINSSDQRDLSRRFPEGLIREKISRLQARLAMQQAPVYFVHLTHRTQRLDTAYQTGIMELAADTGGTGVFCRSVTDVPDNVARIFDSAVNHYLLWVTVPPKTPKNIAVALESGDRPLAFRSRFVLR